MFSFARTSLDAGGECPPQTIRERITSNGRLRPAILMVEFDIAELRRIYDIAINDRDAMEKIVASNPNPRNHSILDRCTQLVVDIEHIVHHYKPHAWHHPLLSVVLLMRQIRITLQQCDQN